MQELKSSGNLQKSWKDLKSKSQCSNWLGFTPFWLVEIKIDS